jgi:hypothetical protein
MAGQSTNPALERLDCLIGAWTMEATLGGHRLPPARTTFRWWEEAPFLVQHTDLDRDPFDAAPLPEDLMSKSPMPVTAMIGLDDSCEEFSMLHADARGVVRVYHMTLNEAVWKIWRNARTFHQRFVGRFNDDATKITAVWEKSRDGSRWEHDLDMIYTKLDQTQRL